MLIADRFTHPDITQRVAQAVEGGIRWILLRDYEASPQVWERVARALRERFSPDVTISVNRHLDLARREHLGFHTGQGGPTVAYARRLLGPDALIGYSAHTLDELQQTHLEGGDYAFLSPVFSTSSKPRATPLGLQALAQAHHRIPALPIFALGGITPERVGPCLQAGAYGVAVLSGILHTPDPAEAARRYLAALKGASRH